jgi:hypothetical protein
MDINHAYLTPPHGVRVICMDEIGPLTARNLSRRR